MVEIHSISPNNATIKRIAKIDASIAKNVSVFMVYAPVNLGIPRRSGALLS